MILEIAMATLLNVSDKDALGHKKPDLLQPAFSLEVMDLSLKYSADLFSEDMKTASSEMAIGYNLTNWLQAGYSTKTFDNQSYGNSGDYVYLKFSYKFKN